MTDVQSPCVLVGVTGGIAAYKSCELVRLLQKAGMRVKVCMTQHATQFVGPTTFRSLTGEKVAIDLFDDPTDPIHHISLAREADLIVVAPATANILAKMAHGIADDLLSTTLLAARCPIVVAPAMNTAMWEAAATQENLHILQARGVHIIQPDSGYLACGEVSAGRLADPYCIAESSLAVLGAQGPLQNERVLITCGGTQELIDPVRFIGNRSTGKMGVALARAARRLGAQVELICGSCEVEMPVVDSLTRVSTAADMHRATLEALQDATIVICAAAVADYAPRYPADHKLKKGHEDLSCVELVQTPDILADVSRRRTSQIVVGFAAETDHVVQYAQAKRAQKGCDALVANDVSRTDSGFGADTNKAWWITSNDTQELPLMSKYDLAREILLRTSRLRESSTAHE